VLVPGVLALLPEYAGLSDPVAELRAACEKAVGWLEGPVEIVADAQGRRVAEHLLAAVGSPALEQRDGGEPASYLVVGNGSAKRTEKAPGHLDERAAGFDAELGRSLREGLTESLRAIDLGLADELWATAGPLVALGGLPGLGAGETLYDDDPFGVQYWVMRWTCGS